MTYLVVVLRWRQGEVEQAGRDVHAVSGHCSIAVTTDETKRIMGEVVVINEAGNCKVIKRIE